MNVGIIGFGEGGRSSLRGVVEAGSRVLAIADINEKKLKSETYKDIIFYDNSEELMRRTDVELIIVATPDNEHFHDIELALKLGKKVFVEKPLVTTMEELARIEMLVLQYEGKLFYSEKYSFSTPAEVLLKNRDFLGDYLYGTTFYTMGMSEKIMGKGKWRTECSYNPCAGGLSHNFMMSLLFSKSNIKRIRAAGRILTYQNNLGKHKGYDFMEGTLEFNNGSTLNWVVDLSTTHNNSLFGHRTVSQFLQFKNGSLAYAPSVGGDILKIDGVCVGIEQEPDINEWEIYDNQLYAKMYADVLNAIKENRLPRHSIDQGINVTKACIAAYHSAQTNGSWIEVS